MKFQSLAVVALLVAAPAAAVNVVANGDFSAGNTGFTSGYAYQAPGTYGSAIDEGEYAVDINSSLTHVAWVNLADHTTGTGNFLIANGSGQNVPLWVQTVTVTPNTTYNFSAWVSDVCCNGVAPALNGQFPPSFVFRVSDGETTQAVGNFAVPLNSAGTWFQFGGNYVNVSNTSLTLSIVNLNTLAGGNDLGLDDISFASVATAIPEAPTWSMLIAGFGLVGLAGRRRSRRVAA